MNCWSFLGLNPFFSATSIGLFLAHLRWPTFRKLEGRGASGAAVSPWSAGCELWKLLTSSALDDGKWLCFPLWWGDRRWFKSIELILKRVDSARLDLLQCIFFAKKMSQGQIGSWNCGKLRYFKTFFCVSILMPHHEKSNCHATTHAPTFHGVKQNSVILPGGIRCIREVCLQMRVLQLFMWSSTLLTMRPSCPRTSPKCDRWCPWTSSLVPSFVPWLVGSRRLVPSG